MIYFLLVGRDASYGELDLFFVTSRVGVGLFLRLPLAARRSVTFQALILRLQSFELLDSGLSRDCHG